jgi:hypothetical protein
VSTVQGAQRKSLMLQVLGSLDAVIRGTCTAVETQSLGCLVLRACLEQTAQPPLHLRPPGGLLARAALLGWPCGTASLLASSIW